MPRIAKKIRSKPTNITPMRFCNIMMSRVTGEECFTGDVFSWKGEFDRGGIGSYIRAS